jgi:hypothetical protein
VAFTGHLSPATEGETEMTPLNPEFTFAGFTWPRYVADMACGRPAMARKREIRRICGGYYHAPRPNASEGRGFYLADAGMPGHRWQWADEMDSVNIQHRGWFCDDDQDQTIRGIVILLPHGRYLAGWSMGEGMASSVGATVYASALDAAYAADEEARCAAEREREYQAQQAAELEGEEA